MIDNTTFTPAHHEEPKTQPLTPLRGTPAGQLQVRSAAEVLERARRGWKPTPIQEPIDTQEPPKGIMLAAGPVDRMVSDWLLIHDALVATIELRHTPMTLIVLPEAAIVAKDGREWRYSVSFYGPDGNEEGMYLEVITDGINAAATTITLQGTLEEEEEKNDAATL